MAKVTIAGEAVVVTSSVTLADLKKVKKYRPDALVLKGGEDGKEEIFRVGVCNGAGRINTYGAEFGSETHDENKFATITIMTDGFGEDICEGVAEAIGVPLLNLNKIEANIPAVLAEIDAQKDEILSNITVAQ